ncbi:MAG: methyltransferase family protein [Bryobacteraceae bacterium]
MWGVLYAAWVVSETAILIFTRARTRTAGYRHYDRGSLFLLWPVIIASISLGMWYGRLHPPDLLRDESQTRRISLTLLVLGLAVRWMAILKLGRSFTANVVIQDEQRVEKTGVFRVIRHPSYAGLLIIFTGIGLQTRSWTGFLIILVPITTTLLYRIHIEEAALRNAFGEEYRSYCRSTKRLIPGVF